MILDAYAVLALLMGEPEAPVVRDLLGAKPRPALTALGVAEVLDHLVRAGGATGDDAALDLAQIGLADPSPVGEIVGLRAGLLRPRHHDRRTRAVSLADCVAAEVARASVTARVTADPHVLDLCSEKGIATVALPDSGGRTCSRG